MPIESVRSRFRGDLSAEGLDVLARRFTFSTLVVLQRLVDAELVRGTVLGSSMRRRRSASSRSSPRRRRTGPEAGTSTTSDRNASAGSSRAVVASAREGGTSYRDAYKLLGTKKHSTFEALAERVGTR